MGYPLNAHDLSQVAAILASLQEGGVFKERGLNLTMEFWRYFDQLCAEESERDEQRTGARP